MKTGMATDEDRELGELPLKITIEQSNVKRNKLLIHIRVTIDGSDEAVPAEVYKFVNGKELPIGKTDSNGYYKTITTFSCPDTFSIVSLSYQKKYLFVGIDCMSK